MRKRATELTSKLLRNIRDKDAGLLRAHDEEDWKHDEDMQSFDTNIASSGAISTEYLKDVVNYVKVWNQTTVNFIEQLKKDKRKNSRFQNVVDEYKDNSQEMLDLLSELDKFVRSAFDIHSSIETVVQEYFDIQENPKDSGTSSTTHDHYKRISEKLKNIKAAARSSLAESLLQKVQPLITMHQQLLENLTVQKKKLDRKQQAAIACRVATNTLFISSVTGMLAASVAAATTSTVCPTTAAVAAALAATSGVLMQGRHWISSSLKKWANNSEEKEKQVEEMLTSLASMELKNEENQVEHYYGLGNIKHLIDLVVNEIDSSLGQSDFAIAEEHINVTMKDIQKKLESFMNKIEGLKGEVDECITELMKTRVDVEKAG
ncbi:PREDICTED: uncharacterized protein LOC103335572 [Prunus mume]|uniref:Uncharacterized protein LOC103335572 n=1 Tax=Prunus mume TaxID=102107 RepID=A0ABM0PAN7_PRUMU|nr:PREDICTED: uncharacterized protein LOC103335572 [Prunus mume]